MPEDYYNMLPADFKWMANGHIKRINRESSNHRRAAFLILIPHVQKLNWERFCADFWPLMGDRQQDTEKIETPEEDFWQTIKKQNKRISDGRRSKFRRRTPR